MLTTAGAANLPVFQYQRPINDARAAAAEFAPRADEPGTAGATATSDRLNALQARLDELKSRQLSMSNHDYLLEKLSLSESIATERQNLGENLDTFSVRVDGQTFNLAGRVMGPGGLDFAKLADDSGVELARLRTGTQGGNTEIRLSGVDIRV